MSSLPPGCRFYPSEQQLLCYYLTSKNRTNKVTGDGTNNMNGYDLIKELDLYDYEPFDLPEIACYSYGCEGRKRHWFCYTNFRGLKESRRGRSRRAKGGFWRISGRIRNVVGSDGNVVLGQKIKFVFYLGNSVKNAVRTDWILYEYALIDHVKASYVLCHIFVKSRGGNSISENVIISSSAEESVSVARNVSIQHDGFHTLDTVKAEACHGNSVDRKSNSSKCPERLSTELDDQVPTGLQSNIESNKLVSAPGLSGGDMFVDAETVQQLVAILEGDFIELDDLVD